MNKETDKKNSETKKQEHNADWGHRGKIMPFLFPLGLIPIILGLVLLAIAYYIFQVTRSPSIGAYVVLVIIIGLALIVYGAYLLATSNPTIPINT